MISLKLERAVLSSGHICHLGRPRGRMEKEMVEVEEEFNENEKESIGEKEEEVEDKQSVPRR